MARAAFAVGIALAYKLDFMVRAVEARAYEIVHRAVNDDEALTAVLFFVKYAGKEDARSSCYEAPRLARDRDV